VTSAGTAGGHVNVLGLVLLLLSTGLISTYVGAPVFSATPVVVSACSNSPLNLSQGATNATLPGEGSDPVISGNNVYVSWSSSAGGSSEVLFARSTNEGTSFGASVALSNNTKSTEPRLAASGQNVYAVWHDASVATGAILFRVSHDNGTSFSAAVDLSSNFTFSHGPQISALGDHVYVVWIANSPLLNLQVVFRESDDEGSTFGPAINLSNDSGPTQEAAMAASGSNVYVTWEDQSTGVGQIGYSVSHDYGMTFPENSTDLSQIPSPQHAREPLFAVSGSYLYVLWRTDTNTFPDNSEEFLLVSSDNGTTFPSGPVNLSNNPGISRMDDLAAYGPNLYVIWRDNTNGTFDLYYVASHDHGATFSHVVDLSGNTAMTVVNQDGAYDDHPRVDVNGSDVYVVWDANISNDYEVFFRASHDSGATFGSAVNLSSDAGKSGSPEVAAGSNYTAVMWVSGTGAGFSPNVYFDACSSEEIPIDTTITTVTCPNAVPANQPATCTVNVSGGNATSPTGTVSFSDSGSGIFNPAACALTSGSCSVAFVAGPGSEGTHIISVSYGGDNNHAGSGGIFSISVTPRPTTTSVACTPASVSVNALTNCMATVIDAGGGTKIVPSGTVGFASSKSGTFLGSNCVLLAGSCSVAYVPSPGAEGKQTVTARYQGDVDHYASSATASLTVTKRTISAVLTCASPYRINIPISCTLTITDTGTGTPLTPTGTVTFSNVGTGTFSSNTCVLAGSGAASSCSTSFTPTTTGSHTVTAAFSGNTNQPSATKSLKFKVTK